MRTRYSRKVLEDGGERADLKQLLPYIYGTRGKQAYVTGDYTAPSSPRAVSGLIRTIPTFKELMRG